ncbi:hypothetical protein RJ639_004504 [Escallonia herrerae]|uniref:Reverse transcriptase Ty1/copia-type domain-containing protein n=1 Tax=Escallonia herrerae TaxID=1293975 RepID=A0AA89AVB0_9ASTE|nr:hypothetical protein RJ639_004504 [Escallonia herrerae]
MATISCFTELPRKFGRMSRRHSENENTSELFEIKDQDSGKMIGNAKECAGLYLLKDGNPGENSATSKDEYQFWHLYNESTDSFPLISHINPENNTKSTSQEETSPPDFHAQDTGKWKNLVYSRKPRDNEDPNPSTAPAESDGKRTILIVYVDDIILTGDDYEEMNRLKTILAKEFEIKDLEKLRYFLGMEVARSNKEISISQQKYTLDLLKETGMLGCKPVDTPMDLTCKLGMKEGNTPIDKGRYQRLIGRLIYLSHTRPDIGFSVSVIALDLLQTGDPLLVTAHMFGLTSNWIGMARLADIEQLWLIRLVKASGKEPQASQSASHFLDQAADVVKFSLGVRDVQRQAYPLCIPQLLRGQNQNFQMNYSHWQIDDDYPSD